MLAEKWESVEMVRIHQISASRDYSVVDCWLKSGCSGEGGLSAQQIARVRQDERKLQYNFLVHNSYK